MSSGLEKVIKATKAGGEVLKKYFGESLDVVQKTSAADFKTKADDESEEAILKILTAEFPGYNIYAEEGGEVDKGSEFTFAIDPLDGTNNFVLGIPNFSVSIGLLKGEEIILGVIYSPMIDNVYYAEKGGGAYMDGKKLSVNSESDVKKASICHGILWGSSFEEEIRVTKYLYSKDAKRVMVNWSPTFDFCMLALGRVEGVINNGCALHDFAAGKIIAREAGAMITDLNGSKEKSDRNQFFIASNVAKIHEHIIEVMSKR